MFEPFKGQLFSLFGYRMVLLLQTPKLTLYIGIHFSSLMMTLQHGLEQGFSRFHACDVFRRFDIPIMGGAATHADPNPDPKMPETIGVRTWSQVEHTWV